MRTVFMAFFLSFLAANTSAWAQALPYEKNDKIFVVSALLRHKEQDDQFKLIQAVVRAKDKQEAVEKVSRDMVTQNKGFAFLSGMATDVTPSLEQHCQSHI